MSHNFTQSESEVSEDQYTNPPFLRTGPIYKEEMRIDRGIANSPVYATNFPSRPPEPVKPVKRTRSASRLTDSTVAVRRRLDYEDPVKPVKRTRSTSRLTDSTDAVRRRLGYEEEGLHEFSVMKLIAVRNKKGIQEVPSKPEFLDWHKLKEQKTLPSSSQTFCVSPLKLIKGLSKHQLVALLGSLTASDPSLSSSLNKLLPKPDLTGLINRLTYLRHNIYKAMPVTRLSVDSDSLAHNRVYVHLEAFTKSLLDDLLMLVDAGQWVSVLEYVILSWNIVEGTPVWTNPIHNASKNNCFKHLAIAVIKTIKQKNFSPASESRNKLIQLMTGSVVKEVQLCREKLLSDK